MRRGMGAVLGVSALLLGCGDPLHFMNEEWMLRDGEEQLVGAGCMELAGDGGDSGSGSAAADPGGVSRSVSYRVDGDDNVTVHVDVNGRPVFERRYGRGFLRTGEVDEVFIDLPDGTALLLKHWGGPDCDLSPPE